MTALTIVYEITLTLSIRDQVVITTLTTNWFAVVG